MTDYTDIATLKQRGFIQDTQHDTTLSALITAASRAIDRLCLRPDNGFVGQTQTRVYDVLPIIAGPVHVVRESGIYGVGEFTAGVPQSTISVVDLDPLLSATSVATDEDGDGTFETMWSATGSPPDYDLLPVNAALNGKPYRQIRNLIGGQRQFPVGERRLQIVGTWGEAVSAPPVIAEATLLLAARWYERRTAPFGVSPDMGAGSIKLPAIDPDIETMLCRAGYVDQWFFV